MWLNICKRMRHMRIISRIILIVSATLLCGHLSAQSNGYDVFVPIVKYMEKGDVEALSAWFADNLDVAVVSSSENTSRNQAKHILKDFFRNYTPSSLKIVHTAGQANMKYALGNLDAGGENFQVTIFVSRKKDTYRIQQLKIERRR